MIIHFLQQDNTHISSILVSLNKPNYPELTEDKTGSDVPGKGPIKQDFAPHVSLRLLYFIITQLSVCLHSSEELDVSLSAPPLCSFYHPVH